MRRRFREGAHRLKGAPAGKRVPLLSLHGEMKYPRTYCRVKAF